MTMRNGKTVYSKCWCFDHGPLGTEVCGVNEGCRLEHVAYADSYLTSPDSNIVTSTSRC